MRIKYKNLVVFHYSRTDRENSILQKLSECLKSHCKANIFRGGDKLGDLEGGGR